MQLPGKTLESLRAQTGGLPYWALFLKIKIKFSQTSLSIELLNPYDPERFSNR